MPSSRLVSLLLPVLLLGTLLAVTACNSDEDDQLTVYSGRSESLIKPLIDQFSESTGIDVAVKYGSTSELAALLLEEGGGSNADVFLAQDAGALGAVASEGLFAELDDEVTSKVRSGMSSPDGLWVGVSGRARVVVYNPDLVSESDLPSSLNELTEAKWSDQVGWAPANGSFQAFVTGWRKLEGDAAATEWLEAMEGNGVTAYPDNRSIVSAVAAGEISAGLVNHYYLFGFLNDQGDGFKARNHFTEAGDPGSLVNVAGVGILDSSDNADAAADFVEFLLSEDAQSYFAEETFEYPLVAGIAIDDRLKPLDEIDPPDIDLSDLEDLQGTVALLRNAGVLP